MHFSKQAVVTFYFVKSSIEVPLQSPGNESITDTLGFRGRLYLSAEFTFFLLNARIKEKVSI